MRKINSSIIFLIVGILAFIISTSLLLLLNVQGIKYPYFTDYQVEIVSLIKGVYAVFGGVVEIKRGFFIKDNFVEDKSLTQSVNLRFDYITFFFLILNLISIILIYLFYFRKNKLIFGLSLYVISLIGVGLEPTFFWVVSGGISEFDTCFSPTQGNGIVGIGAITYVCIMSILAIYILIRIIYLYKKKLTID